MGKMDQNKPSIIQIETTREITLKLMCFMVSGL
jgi:hypothetical protein